MKKNPASKIVVLEDEFAILSQVFLKIPWEYAGMGSKVGKRYDATKDALKIFKLSKKDFLYLILDMGRVWANNEG